MNLDRYKTFCLYVFVKGIGLRAQTPNAAQNTKVLFDSGMLYLNAIAASEPGFLDQITALELPDDIALGLGSRFSHFDAKAYLTARAESKRLDEKMKSKKSFGSPS